LPISGHQEIIVNPALLFRLSRLAATLAVAAVLVIPNSAFAVDQPNPPAPPADGKPKQDKTASTQELLRSYRVAYDLVYNQHDYQAGIVKLRALGHDEHGDVATMIGYASRKLGRYDDAKYWYDKALAANPDNTLTLSYYGMWHVEQGNVVRAGDYLAKVQVLCGNTTCGEYAALKEVIDGASTTY
jgi:tetratricopeptide (TPR) repeat protein